MIKKILLMVILSLLFLGHSLLAQTITLGYVDFPPYEFQTKGKPDGILVSIVQSIFKKSNVPLTLKFYPFKRAYEKAKKGEIDGLFNFYKNEERLKLFDYSQRVIKNPLVFFIRKNDTLMFSELSDLKGKKIGIIRGYTYGAAFDKSVLFTREESNTHQSNLKKLLVGRIDAYPCDQLVGIHVAKKNGLMTQLKILPTPLKVMDGYIGFTKGKHGALIEKINQAISELNREGEIDRVINEYIEGAK